MEGHIRKLTRAIEYVVLVFLLFPNAATAQNYGGWTPQSLMETLARFQLLPPEERSRRQTELLARYSLDQAWALTARMGQGQKPTVHVSDSGLPPFVEGGVIFIPVEFYAQIVALAWFIGHDASLQSGEFLEVPSPLLYRPFAESRLLAVAPHAEEIFEPNRLGNLTGFISMSGCGPSARACQLSQGAAILCASIFVVAHEVMHVREGHEARKGGAYPLAEELQADAGGMKAIQVLWQNLESQGGLEGEWVRSACLGVPAAFFELNRRRALAESARQGYEQRKEAVLRSLGERREDAEALVEPELMYGGLGTAQVSFSDAPTLVLLDGVEVEPTEVTRFVLPVGRHRMLAIGSGGIVASEFRVLHRKVVRVSFDLKPFTSLAPSEISSMVSRRKWEDVLRATSGNSLRPKSSAAAPAQWAALRGLGLGAWIDTRDISPHRGRDARRGRSWRDNSQPLSSWDPDLASATE